MAYVPMRLWGTLALAAALSTQISACQKRKFNAGAGVQSDRPLSAAQCGEPLQDNRPNPAHCEGPFAIDGDFTLDEAQFAETSWAGSDYGTKFIPGLFGTTTLYDQDGKALMSGNKPKVIRDLHYHLGQGRVGMRFIPVAPNSKPDGRLASGEPVKGSEILDRILREQIYDNPRDRNDASVPLFALAAYLYPGTQLVYVKDLAESKSQGSIGHMSAYIGKGESRHSPYRLHDNEWSVQDHEPSTLIAVRIKGADPKVVNRNLQVITRIMNELNGGPQFPGDYTFDPVRVYNLQAMFEFFRKWIIGGAEADKLKNDPTWGIYCAEFVTLSTNLGLNLPLSRAYFERIWPNGVGTQLWTRFKERYQEVFQEPMPEDLIGPGFKPLWEIDGVASPLRLTEPSASMAWPLDTTADLISAIVENFGAWPDVGPALSTAMMLNFADTAAERVGVQREQFVNYVLPMAKSAFLHHVSTKPELTSPAQLKPYTDEVLGTLRALGIPLELIHVVDTYLQSPEFGSKAFALRKVGLAEAWNNYRREIEPAMQNARKFAPPFTIGQQMAYRAQQMNQVRRLQADAAAHGDRQLVEHYQNLLDGVKNLKTFVRFNSPPSLAFRVANGLVKSHKALDVWAVGTIFHAEKLRTKSSGKGAYMVQDLAPSLRPSPEPETPTKDWDPEVFHGEEGEVGRVGGGAAG